MTSRGAERIAPIPYSVRHPEESCLAVALTRQIGRNWGGSFGIALITNVAERRPGITPNECWRGRYGDVPMGARTHALADYLA